MKADGAASCRCATRPVLRTNALRVGARPGHPIRWRHALRKNSGRATRPEICSEPLSLRQAELGANRLPGLYISEERQAIDRRFLPASDAVDRRAVQNHVFHDSLLLPAVE